MTEKSRKPSKELVKLLTIEGKKLHLSLGDPCGPTYVGGACLMLYKLMSESGPCNLITLDLRNQCISIFDHLRIYRPRPTTEDETMLPFLEKIVVNVSMDLDGTMEHYPPLAEPKKVRSMKVFLSGMFKHEQTDRFLETWDFTRKFTLAGEAPLNSDEEFFDHYEDFSMPTVRILSLPVNSPILTRNSLRFVYPKIEKVILTNIRDATLPIDLTEVTSRFPDAEVVFSGKRKAALPGKVEICEKCGVEATERLQWTVGLTAPAAHDNQSVKLLSCTTMAVTERRINPLDVSLVYVQGRPALLTRENSSGETNTAENLIRTRHAQVHHLIFEACKEGAYEHESELLTELTAFCKDKFIKLLAMCKTSLTKIEVSAEFAFGCSLDKTADSQISALQGAFTKVSELSIEPDLHMEFDRFNTQSVSSEKLIPFLRMFLYLNSLRFCAGKWVCWSNLDAVLGACPHLEKLYVSTSTVDAKTALQSSTAHRVRTLVFDFPEAEVPCDFSGLKNCQEVEYLLLRTSSTEDVDEEVLQDCFKAMPHLRWLIVVMSHAGYCLVGYCAEPGSNRVELKTHVFAEPEQLATAYPQLYSIFWTDILAK
ncbi:unnamed protein product [Schistocephalus solidus]|uniref:FBD domain-containing protein n=1 Tax=Schistocephalus solidus TaxID=70667 RepID=A0A183T2C6_SCHSO|nr:unnamed protein product [Schistocephalus solidus]